MEDKNMELNTLQVTNEDQLRHMVKHLTAQLENMHTICKENSLLRAQNCLYKINEEENLNDQKNEKSVKRQILELNNQLKIRKELSQTWKEEREYFFEQEEQLNQVTKERDFLSRQLPFKEECLQLRKKNRDLEVTMSKQEKQFMEKIHVLALEVEKLQEKKSKLQEKNEKLQEERNKLQNEKSLIKEETSKDQKQELAQKQRALIIENRCSDLEKQLERAFKELHIKHPPNKWTDLFSEKPFDIAMLYNKHIELVEKLTVERRRRDRKDHIILEKEKKNDELKHSMSRLLPPDRFELIPKCQWVIREQSNKISALMAQVEMFKSKAEEDKREREKLVDKVAAIKKKYLNGKMQNTDLRDAFRRSGAKQVPEEKSGVIKVPPSSNVLLKKSREKQVNTKTQTDPSMPPTHRR